MRSHIPESGDGRGQALVGAGSFAVAGQSAIARTLGVPFQFHTIYGTLRDASGEMYTLTRRIIRGEGGPMRLILQTTQGGLPHLKLHAAGKTAARAGGCQYRDDEGEVRIESATDSPDKAFRIACSATKLEWTEQDCVSIHGTAIGPEFHWHLPWPERQFLYISRFYFVSGEILGREVRGFICVDDTYKPDEMLTPGRKHPWNPLIDDGLGIAIFNWGNHYADGSSEVGLFALGHRRFGLGLYRDRSGQVITTPDVSGEIHLGPDGRLPSRIDFQLNGQSWRFQPDPRGTMPNLASPAQELDGRMQPAGSLRKPDAWFSWGQTFPGNAVKTTASLV